MRQLAGPPKRASPRLCSSSPRLCSPNRVYLPHRVLPSWQPRFTDRLPTVLGAQRDLDNGGRSLQLEQLQALSTSRWCSSPVS
jgi:hypothetical protein